MPATGASFVPVVVGKRREVPPWEWASAGPRELWPPLLRPSRTRSWARFALLDCGWRGKKYSSYGRQTRGSRYRDHFNCRNGALTGAAFSDVEGVQEPKW